MDYGFRLESLALKVGLLIISIAITGLGLFYDFDVPLFEKPDELKHLGWYNPTDLARLPLTTANTPK